MRITATHGDEQHTTDEGIDGLWRLMQWPDVDKQYQVPFTYQGYTITASKHVTKGIESEHVGKAHRRTSIVRRAKAHLGYTESMRPLGETCGTCTYRVNRMCINGGFVTKVNSGCDKWKPLTD